MKPIYTPISEFAEFMEKQGQSTLSPLMVFVPLMEKEFDRVNKALKSPLTPEAALKFLDFDDLAPDLYKKLSQSGLLVDFEWEDWVEGQETLKGIRTLPRLNAIKICKLLTLIIRNDQIQSGYFEEKLKQGVILDLLKKLNLKLVKS